MASVFFITTGGLAIGGARSGNKCLVVATLVMAIFSAIISCTLLSLAGISMSMTHIGSEGFIASTIEMVIGGVMLIVGITSASLTCRPLCCSQASCQQGLVYYAPNQVELASLNLPRLPNLPTPLLSSAQVYHKCLEMKRLLCYRLWCPHVLPLRTRKLPGVEARSIRDSNQELPVCVARLNKEAFKKLPISLRTPIKSAVKKS